MSKFFSGFIILLPISIFSILAGLICGSIVIPLGDTWRILLNSVDPSLGDLSHVKNSYQVIVTQVRLPRTVAAYFSGAALSVIGALYQSIFRNSMAEPYILGISSGAALGGVIAMIFFQSMFAINAGAFIAAFAALVIVLSISARHIKVSMNAALLCGIAFSQFAGAIISLLMIMNRDKIERIYMWLLGSFSAIDNSQALTILVAAAAVTSGLYPFSGALDIMSIGEDDARTLGISTGRIRLLIIALTSLLLCVIIPFTGIIGFVGLIVPHFVRMFSGRKHRLLLPFSFMAGGAFMAFSDVAARSIFTETELPVGIVTACIGAPYFIYLSYTKRGSRI